MLNLVNITQARNNLSKLIDQVVEKKDHLVVIRESTPQVVIIPYSDYHRNKKIAKKAKKSNKLPYGIFSLADISDKEIDKITSSWEKTVNELT
ncbi:hypothetical protein A3F58_04085 [Candidatus Roizmanbacteria bacterium RIFCSPHIGHO2_12_FULL_37_9b]|uniref:Antitoxin n=1 Tax=Candidatus Roizmanbacteria bacterium RIFCSPHIGHO2_02_FULL_38_11 TaxID=1802039 RepID=A0A1F7GZY6_9BACT|nr:MAG: hypothetical protein A3C25_05285 [Candidatus Roizmanbacteria bacterium RIFCSPHIGHO2_02_FULL_38_11]OGK32929.1 MAG: hypothetical protein A3F58_04085 [Candidatus Roizmanbacteria bacterium RIFCSPHIGHO2_12_FULL_37_9b]